MHSRHDSIALMHDMNPANFWRDPAMPYVESRRACCSRACYKPHSHPTYSIGSVDGGSSEFTGAGHTPVRLQPGTVVFIPPAHVHACNPMPGGAWSYQMLHIDAEWLEAIRIESVGLRNQRGATEPVRIAQDTRLYRRFSKLNAKLFSEDSVCEKEAVLIEFIGDCNDEAQQALFPPVPTTIHAGKLETVIDFLRAEHADVPTLTELAEVAGMSRYQLIRQFRKLSNIKPLRIRIAAMC